jgi:hypothetical protein
MLAQLSVRMATGCGTAGSVPYYSAPHAWALCGTAGGSLRASGLWAARTRYTGLGDAGHCGGRLCWFDRCCRLAQQIRCLGVNPALVGMGRTQDIDRCASLHGRGLRPGQWVASAGSDGREPQLQESCRGEAAEAWYPTGWVEGRFQEKKDQMVRVAMQAARARMTVWAARPARSNHCPLPETSRSIR